MVLIQTLLTPLPKNRIMKRANILILILLMGSCLVSCKSYRQKTFLDFEFGMNSDEYMAHASKLQSSGIIKNLRGRDFEYTLDLGNGKFAFFNVRVNIFFKCPFIIHLS